MFLSSQVSILQLKWDFFNSDSIECQNFTFRCLNQIFTVSKTQNIANKVALDYLKMLSYCRLKCLHRESKFFIFLTLEVSIYNWYKFAYCNFASLIKLSFFVFKSLYHLFSFILSSTPNKMFCSQNRQIQPGLLFEPFFWYTPPNQTLNFKKETATLACWLCWYFFFRYMRIRFDASYPPMRVNWA